ncbi:MAG: phosphate/phosphite/phosphonate ABC transporter substrate-binding protein [Roseiflexaceae bacterium]|nr:phosphate/phosphite/phosphonate ABC transporter substrate-binding protein [Roseiflexaceae bacterium]
MPKRPDTLVLGAVAYAPKVVTIWEGFKSYFAGHGLQFDYILYSNYETQVEALMDGQCDIAWNSPLAWVRAERLARARGVQVQAIAMRDTDCDLTSVIIVRSDSPAQSVADLKGKIVAVGAVDSPQAYLIPLDLLRSHGLEPGTDFEIQRHDLLGGKHGDHVGGELDAARSLLSGSADAACLIKGNYEAWIADGTIPSGATHILAETPAYDHCNVTVGPMAAEQLVERFYTLLMAMSYDDPDLRPLMDLEGLKQWRAGRVEGYLPLEAAVNAAGFYDQDGAITENDYRY